MDKDVICDYGNLYKAYKKAKSGKKHNSSTAKFEAMSLEGLHMLKEQLENQTYRMNPYNEFKVYEPKERVIKSCSFKDKVVQHCLCDNILLPRLKYEFIKTNYAGQLGKGTHFGMDCLKEHMLEFYNQHGLDGWILKCDITKFFYQIGHEVLKDIVDYYFDDEYTKWLNHLYIDSTAGLGLPLGNQVAQVYALLMLNGLDHFITGELGIELYGRYMDDFYLIAPSKEYLKHCLDLNMIKCVKGFVEIDGSKSEVRAETVVLLKYLREYISEDELEEAIENSKKTVDEIEAEVREVKKKIIAEILREVLQEDK